MVGNEPTQKPVFKDRYPDRLQQILNRLHKQYEDVSFEEGRQHIAQDIEHMDISEADRKELKRRLD